MWYQVNPARVIAYSVLSVVTIAATLVLVSYISLTKNQNNLNGSSYLRQFLSNAKNLPAFLERRMSRYFVKEELLKRKNCKVEMFLLFADATSLLTHLSKASKKGLRLNKYMPSGA